MLAARLPGLLPPLDREQALAVTMIHSAAGVSLPPGGLVTRPPFRSPHHTSSQVAMVGGGSTTLRPGEISISHGGVLFMDELPEFAPRVMDTIRQPLEEGEVSVSRAALHVTIPSRFQLVAAMNPCPCGDGNEPGGCECGDARLRNYVGRVSGPLLDRFDLRVKVDRPDVDQLLDNRPGESSAVVRERVATARRRSLARQGALNNELAARDLDRYAPLEPAALDCLRAEMERGRLSARGYHRVRRVARTIGGPPTRGLGRAGRRDHLARARHEGPGPSGPHDRPGGMNVTELFPEPAVPALSDTERAHLAALAGFDLMSTSRLVGLQAGRSPVEAYAIASGAEAPSGGIAALFERHRGLRERWRASALRHRPADVAERCDRLHVRIVAPGDDLYPPQLTGDPRRPAVLFVQGDASVLDARRVGIVGTRNPTRRGSLTAERFGRELAEAGVVVVSGLALGIDGAAHRGALTAQVAPPVAVVANGHDAPYPKRHASLWAQVAERGAVISEWPPGVAPDPYRFPQRNRILAALSELVVVVESRERGGSLITAREAAERGIDVFAVPGPIDQRSSVGTNRLLHDGAAPAADVDSLLVALGLDHRRAGRRHVDTRARPDHDGATALELFEHRSQSIETVAVELGWELGRAARALVVLERDGWLVEVGGWYESLESVVGTR